MKHFNDARGRLTVVDDRELSFKIKRIFWITSVPTGATRGNHSHRDCEQVIICLAGSFGVQLDDARYALTPQIDPVYAPAGCYIVLDGFSPDAVCLVLCSEYYNEAEVDATR